jgi:hypothetical protein
MSLWHPTKPAYPIADNTYDLGSSILRWRDLYVAGTANVGLLNGWNPNAHASRHGYGGADAVSLDASQITSGRLSLSRIPTSATANRFLVVRTANADPTYDVITAADIPGLDASKIVSGRFTVSRLPDGTSGYVLVGQGTGYDMAWRDISGIAGTITDTQHGTKTGIPFAHHGDWGHYGKIPTSAPTGAAERAYVDSANLYVHDGTSWVLRATKDWNNLINKPSTFPPSTHASTHASGGSDPVSLDASQITSGRLSLSRIPTSATANRVLVVRTANADPTYDQVDWNTDIKNIPSTFPPSAHASTHEYGGTDLVRNLDYLAIRGTTVIDSSRNLTNIASATVSGAADVGSLKIGGTVVITSDRMLANIAYLATSLVPYLDNTYDIGASLSRIRNIYVAGTANVGSVLPAGGAGSGYVGNSTYYWYAVYTYFGYSSDFYPIFGDNTGLLGSTERRWASLYAVNKSAAFKHPLHNPERYIVFKCVESPKVTVEDWGIAKLKDGKAFVGFSEEFVALMSDKAEYAVFLTPEGECNGLYVSKKEFYGFEVRELNNGKSNIRFSWHVKAIRIGDEETPVLEEPAPTEPEKTGRMGQLEGEKPTKRRRKTASTA